jgi:hypothetical protein
MKSRMLNILRGILLLVGVLATLRVKADNNNSNSNSNTTDSNSDNGNKGNSNITFHLPNTTGMGLTGLS